MMAPAHCKKCGAPMDTVADIPTRRRELGLRAFLCPECGAVDSVLIHPDTHFGPKGTTNVEFRIMPNGDDGRWYWEVLTDGREIVARGVTQTGPAACEQAREAAQRAKLVA